MDLSGKNEPQMDVVFFRAGEINNSTFSLASKGCQDFKILINQSDGFEASITVEAEAILGQTVTEESPEWVDVAGPDLPPQGMDFID